jgi:hypothetical protein
MAVRRPRQIGKPRLSLPHRLLAPWRDCPFPVTVCSRPQEIAILQMTMRHDVRVVRAISALRRLLGRRHSPPVAAGTELADFLAAQTAYVAQRTVIEYCRARTGLNWDKLFAEPSFLDRLEVCRWEAYAVVLAEVAELVLIHLRRDGAADPETYLPGVVDAARAALLRHPVPGHRTSWTDAADAIERHLARALLAAPRPVHLVGFQAADVIFDLLPIHADLRRQDRQMFQNSLRFAILGAFDAMTRQFDVAALGGSLLTAGGAKGPAPRR